MDPAKAGIKLIICTAHSSCTSSPSRYTTLRWSVYWWQRSVGVEIVNFLWLDTFVYVELTAITVFKSCQNRKGHAFFPVFLVSSIFNVLGNTFSAVLRLVKTRKYMFASFVRNVVVSFYMYSYARYPFIRDIKTVAHTFTQGNVCLLPRSAHGGWDDYLQSMWFTHKYMHAFQADDGPVCRPLHCSKYTWCGFFAVFFCNKCTSIRPP